MSQLTLGRALQVDRAFREGVRCIHLILDEDAGSMRHEDAPLHLGICALTGDEATEPGCMACVSYTKKEGRA